jgi:hypothetical protein
MGFSVIEFCSQTHNRLRLRDTRPPSHILAIEAVVSTFAQLRGIHQAVVDPVSYINRVEDT